MGIKELNEKCNYMSDIEYVVDVPNYPLKIDSYDKERAIITRLTDKVMETGKPISYLLCNREIYGLEDFPKYSDFVLLLEEKTASGSDFAYRLGRVEMGVLSGRVYGEAVDGVDSGDFLKVKGNQILQGMLINNKKLNNSEVEAAVKGGVDVIKMLDSIDTGYLADLREKLKGG